MQNPFLLVLVYYAGVDQIRASPVLSGGRRRRAAHRGVGPLLVHLTPRPATHCYGAVPPPRTRHPSEGEGNYSEQIGIAIRTNPTYYPRLDNDGETDRSGRGRERRSPQGGGADPGRRGSPAAAPASGNGVARIERAGGAECVPGGTAGDPAGRVRAPSGAPTARAARRSRSPWPRCPSPPPPRARLADHDGGGAGSVRSPSDEAHAVGVAFIPGPAGGGPAATSPPTTPAARPRGARCVANRARATWNLRQG